MPPKTKSATAKTAPSPANGSHKPALTRSAGQAQNLKPAAPSRAVKSSAAKTAARSVSAKKSEAMNLRQQGPEKRSARESLTSAVVQAKPKSAGRTTGSVPNARSVGKNGRLESEVTPPRARAAAKATVDPGRATSKRQASTKPTAKEKADKKTIASPSARTSVKAKVPAAAKKAGGRSSDIPIAGDEPRVAGDPKTIQGGGRKGSKIVNRGRVAAAAPAAEIETTPSKAAVPGTSPQAEAAERNADRAPPARTAATKSVAAALLAARRKAASNLTPPNDLKPRRDRGDDQTKGVVEVADKNIKRTVVENVAPAASVPPVGPASAKSPSAPSPVAASGGPVRRPVMAARPAPAHVGGVDKAATKPVKAAAKGHGFKANEFIVYPAHGVGEIVAIESQEVAGYKLELFVISFVKDKMILKVPLPKVASVGMRKLAEAPVMKRALDTLTGRARIKRTMWSRRAQEYEAKINSGDLVAIAEVVRDLYRSDAQPEQSYSERQLYEAALDRMAREVAVVRDLTDSEALKLIDDQLQKGPRRGKAEEAEADDADETDDVGEAA